MGNILRYNHNLIKEMQHYGMLFFQDSVGNEWTVLEIQSHLKATRIILQRPNLSATAKSQLHDYFLNFK